MAQKKITDIKKVIKALGYSFEGVKAAFISEVAFRQEIILCCIFFPIAFMLDVTPAERALMLGSMMLVMIVEIINTAIETLVERISPELHDLSKKAKDLGSAAVLLSLITVVLVWSLIILG